MITEPTLQQMKEVREAMELEIRQAMDDRKIEFYAESLKQPWSAIYAGSKPDPSYEEIITEPGEWLKTTIPGFFKPFAHKYQRLMTYPFEDLVALAKLIKGIFYCYFAGNQGGKSVWETAWVIMEDLNIHPLQHITYQEVHDFIENKEHDFFKKRPDLDFTVSDKTIRPKPPLHWWVVSPDLPAEAKIEGGEDTPTMKTYIEWCPKRAWNFHRKDKIATITLLGNDKKGPQVSTLNFKSHDQVKKKISGDRVDGIQWDEEPPKPFWEEGKPRIMKKKGIFLLGMTSDWGSWTWELEQKKDDPEYVFCSMDAMSNPFIDKAYRQRLYSTMSKDELVMRRFGKHIQFKGKVFKEFDRNIHVREPFQITNDCMNYVITDWHPVKPIVTTFLSINAKQIWFVWDEVITDSHIVDNVAQEIWQKLSLVDHNIRIRKWLIDPIAKVQQIQSQHGVKPKDIVKMFREIGINYIAGNPEFEAAHTFLCRKMSLREFYVAPLCEFHINELDTWGAKRFQRGNLEGTLRDKLEDANNDTCYNLIYAFNARVEWKFEQEVHEQPWIPPRPSAARIYGGMRV